MCRAVNFAIEAMRLFSTTPGDAKVVEVMDGCKSFGVTLSLAFVRLGVRAKVNESSRYGKYDSTCEMFLDGTDEVWVVMYCMQPAQMPGVQNRYHCTFNIQ